MEIVELLEKVRLDMEDSKIRANNVGNRPHYPVFAAFNGFSRKNCALFINNIRKIWPGQICKNLLFYRYDAYEGGISFRYTDSDDQADIESVYNRISEASRTRDCFAKLDMWCLYNIIDTSELDFDGFAAAYRSLGALKETVDERTRSMAVVVLRESRNADRKRINYAIREFLASASDYDGTVIVSNRARGGMEISSEELCTVISNLILLSDNDALTAADDQFYLERMMKLYSKTPLLMSYSSLRKPTKDILSYMTHEFVKNVYDSMNSSKTKLLSTKELEEIIGVSNGRIELFESYLSEVKSKLLKDNSFFSVFMYMPLSAPVVSNEMNIDSKPFCQLEGINNEAFELIAREYCRRFIDAEESRKLFEDYTRSVNDRLNLMNIGGVSQEKLENVFRQQTAMTAPPDGSLPVREYFIQLVLYKLRTDFINPYCSGLFERICNDENIEKSRENIESFMRRADEELPVTGVDEISGFYAKNMSAYLNTLEGRARIKQLLRIGNTYDDICAAAEETLYAANEFCDEKIDLPFIAIWANALKLHEGEVFSRIRNTLYGDGDDAILLRGSYTVQEELSVYMLHCYDREGRNETDLYKQFKEAYREVSDVQFFNTGNDDSIESVKFYRCGGINLTIGLSV